MLVMELVKAAQYSRAEHCHELSNFALRYISIACARVQGVMTVVQFDRHIASLHSQFMELGMNVRLCLEHITGSTTHHGLNCWSVVIFVLETTHTHILTHITDICSFEY